MINISNNLENLKFNFLKYGLTYFENSEYSNFQISSVLGIPFKYRPDKSPYYFMDNEGYELRISNVQGILGNSEIYWHQDHSHKKGTWYGGVLQGIKNSHLSSTTFCDLELLYNDLSDSQRKKAETVKIKQTINKKYENLEQFSKEACHMDAIDYRLAKRTVMRDMIVVHPVKKTKMLFLSPEFAVLEEHDLSFFEEIINLANKEKYHTIFDWKDGNILIFDNIKFMHKRNSFIGNRILTRTLFQI